MRSVVKAGSYAFHPDHIVRVGPLYYNQDKEDNYFCVITTNNNVSLYVKKDQITREHFIELWELCLK